MLQSCCDYKDQKDLQPAYRALNAKMEIINFIDEVSFTIFLTIILLICTILIMCTLDFYQIA